MRILDKASVCSTLVLLYWTFPAFAESSGCFADSFGTTRCVDGTTYTTDNFGITRDHRGKLWAMGVFDVPQPQHDAKSLLASLKAAAENIGESWMNDPFGIEPKPDDGTCFTDELGLLRC